MNYLALPTCLTSALVIADQAQQTAARIGDRALAVWSFLTQPQAIDTYRWLLAMAGCLVQLIIWSAIWAYAKMQQWMDNRSIELNPITQLTDEDIKSQFEQWLTNLSQEDPYPDDQYQPAQAQTMTPVIAVCRLALSTSHEDYLDREIELADLTVAQLLPIAEQLNVPTRKVRKAKLITAILKAEGYEV